MDDDDVIKHIIQEMVKRKLENKTWLHENLLYQVERYDPDKYHIIITNKLTNKIKSRHEWLFNSDSGNYNLLLSIYYKSDGSTKAHYQQLWNTLYLDEKKEKCYMRTKEHKTNKTLYYQVSSMNHSKNNSQSQNQSRSKGEGSNEINGENNGENSGESKS